VIQKMVAHFHRREKRVDDQPRNERAALRESLPRRNVRILRELSVKLLHVVSEST